MADHANADPFAKIARDVRRLLPLDGIAAPSCAASPVAALRWEGSPIPEVHLGDGWARLDSVNGIPARELVDAAVRLGRRDWQRLLIAEFEAVAVAAGAARGADFLICRAGMPERQVRAMPQGLVTSIWHYLTAGGAAAPDAAAALAGLAHLESPGAELNPAQVRLDLIVLENLVTHEFSYWDHVPRDWDAWLAQFHAAAAPIDRLAHVEALRDLMVMLGDGHTRVDPADPDLLRRGMLPFQIDWIGEAAVAVTEDRTALLDPLHPVIAAMGGRPIRDWQDAARPAVPRGTSAMRRNWLARELRRVGALAAKLGVPVPGGEIGRIDVMLTNEAGTAEVTRRIDLRASDPRPEPTMVRSAWLPDSTGYLALRGRMTADPLAIAEAHDALRGFASARALVIDIRDNPGGSRDLLRAVIGYLLPPGAATVTSWARLRREAGTDPDAVEHVLAGRYMRPWNWQGWSMPARTAAEAFAARLSPEWPAPDDDRFGPLNLLIAERLPEHGDLHLSCPVALLVNLRNYSAADIFASSLAVLPQVSVLGTATAGGSGFARRTVLPGSNLAIQISTMASGMISGDLFENRGVVPDEIVQPALEQWQGDAAADPLVVRAVRRITQPSRSLD